MPFSSLFGKKSKDYPQNSTKTNQKVHDVPKSSSAASLASHSSTRRHARESDTPTLIHSEAVVSRPQTAQTDADHKTAHSQQSDAPLTGHKIHGALRESDDTEKSHLPTDTPNASSPRPSLGAQGSLLSKRPDFSQKIWNDAYDEIEADEVDLVKSYTLALKAYLEDAKPSDTPPSNSDHFLAQFSDRIRRQEYLEELVVKGKTKVSTTVKVSNVVGNIADTLLKTKPVADLVLTIPQAAPAALPWAGVCVGLQILCNPKTALNSNLAGIAYVASRMDWYCALVEHLLHTTNVDSPDMSFELVLEKLEQKVVQLYKAILLYQMRSVCSYYRNQGWNFFLQLWDFDDWNGALDSVEQAQKSLLDDWDKYDRAKASRVRDELIKLTKLMESHLDDIRQTLRDHFFQQDKRLQDQEVHEILSHLFVVNPLDDMTRIVNDREPLIDDVHKWILKDEKYEAFTNWADSNTPQRQLLWIKGDAGTGKTMLMISIVRELSSQLARFTPSLSCFFFQSQGKTRETWDKASDALRSLAWMLLTSQPDLIVHLQGDYKGSKDKLFIGANVEQAMLRNLEEMLKHARPVYFILDALDECDHDFDRILDLIASSLSISTNVKWLVSSRPELDLLTRLDNLQKNKLKITQSPLELDMENRKDRVQRYIDYKLLALQHSKKFGKSYQDEKIVNEISKEVSHRAEDNLLWLSLVFDDLLQMRGHYAVKTIQKYPSGLSQLYDHKMSMLEHEKGEYLTCCKDVLVTVSHASRALSLAELAVLTPWSDDTDPSMIVEKCHSFITETEETVFLNHKSAKDYLVSIKSRLKGGVVQSHADIARVSIEAMKLRLKRNIYELKHWCNPVDMEPPEPDPLASVAYSCEFWVDHLRLAIEQREESFELQRALCTQGFDFLKEHFLHWLESLCLLRKYSNGIMSVRKLLQIIQLSDGNNEFASFLMEAVRFATTYGSIIERAPMQIYGAALVFCPAKSQIKELFWQRDRSDFVKSIKGIRSSWNLCLQILETTGPVKSLAFSSDGKKLATGSLFGEVRLWNVETGTSELLEGHTRKVRFVGFLSDDKKLASGSDDGVVRIWTIETGASKLLEVNNKYYLTSMAVSSDGAIVALGSIDGVMVLDVETNCTKRTLETHSDSVTSIAFSSDSRTLAFGDGHKQVQLCNIETGAFKLLEAYTDKYVVPAFSPDGKMLALRSGKETVQLWDVGTGRIKRTLKAQTEKITAITVITFSSDNVTLACGDEDGKLQLWNTKTGAVKLLKSHTTTVMSVAFSRDGTMLVSGSERGAIRLSHVETGTSQVLSGHYGWPVDLVAFSPDGTTVASAFTGGNTVRLWSVEKSNFEHPETHDSEVDSIMFSADGTVLLSMSRNNGTLRLWDIKAGTSRFLEIYLRNFPAVAFSSDGRRLAVSDGSQLGLWNLETGALQHIDESFTALYLAFSPDGETLAYSRDGDNNTIPLHWWRSKALDYSPDGKTLASKAGDEVRLWNIKAGTFRVLGASQQVAFLPDGKRLALDSGSGRGIRLWDVETGAFQLLSHSLEFSYRDFLFLPDGKTLAASDGPGRVVQLWSAETVELQRTIKYDYSYGKIFSFSSDKSCMYTSDGTISLDTSASTFSALLDEKRWIYRGSEPVLWLPPEHVPTSVAVFEDVLALGHESGEVTIIEFYPEAEARVHE